MRTVALAMLLTATAAIPSSSAQSPSAPVIVQMSYWAQPGREDDVLRIRVEAAEVLAKKGLPRGRVWRTMDGPRATKDSVGPTVIWQGEFTDEATFKKYEEVAEKDPDFLAMRKQMGTVTITTRTERRYFREAR